MLVSLHTVEHVQASDNLVPPACSDTSTSLACCFDAHKRPASTPVAYPQRTLSMGVMPDSAVLLVRSMAPWMTATSWCVKPPPKPAAAQHQAGINVY
jgi:hypothetical protein